MDIAKYLKLSPGEIRILKKVLLLSVGTCVLLVAAAWAIRWVRVKSAALDRQARENSENIDPLARLAAHQEIIPIDIAAHRIAAEHYRRTQEPAKAIQHLLRIVAADHRDRQARLELATMYLKAGRYQDARDEFSSLIEAGDEDSLAQAAEARLGLTLFYLNKYRESAARLDSCLERYPHSSEAACYRGQVEAAINPGSPLILSSFRRALSLNPGYVEALYQRARYYMNKADATTEDYHKARADLLAVLDSEPLHAKAHSRLGMVYYYLGQYDAAKSSYRTALALNPNDYNTHYNLGETYYMGLDDPVKALVQYKKALAIDTTHARANFRVGLICLANDATNEAVLHLRRAVRRDQGNIRYRLQLGVAYEREGMTKQARSTYRSILELDPLHEVARQKLKLMQHTRS